MLDVYIVKKVVYLICLDILKLNLPNNAKDLPNNANRI